jgi:hypothetical protein
LIKSKVEKPSTLTLGLSHMRIRTPGPIVTPTKQPAGCLPFVAHNGQSGLDFLTAAAFGRASIYLFI